MGPCLQFGRSIYPLRRSCVIGRSHQCSLNECGNRGAENPLDISIPDSKGYVSRHHARIRLESAGECWIEDLHSMNGTFIVHVAKQRKSSTIERLNPGAWYALSEGKMVCMGYNPSKGPYLLLSYHHQLKKTHERHRDQKSD